MPALIQLDSIRKSFGPVHALRGVSLQVEAGEVHGILGENGAGKSTLVNLLFGHLAPDAGTIAIAGKPVQLRSPRVAQRLGIGMVHQHFKLVPTLSVLDNLALATGRGLGVWRRGPLIKRLAELAETLHWQVDPHATVGTLSVGVQQRLEILKALAVGGRVLILDEPTAVLTPQEVAELLPALRTLAQRGMTILFISHKLAEVQQLCDAVTILRQGTVVHTGPQAALSPEQMAEKMVGSRVVLPRVETAAPHVGPPLLELRNITLQEESHHRPLLNGVSLRVRGGEIVGIAGVDGNGQRPLVDVLVGTRAPTSGEVLLENRPAGSVRSRVEHLGLIPEDRQRQALALTLSVEQNLLLKEYRRRPFSRWGWLRLGQWRQHAQALVKTYDVRCSSPGVAVGTLSGGNQQKAVIARELHGQPRIVIAVNPTRGLDIGATAFVMQQLLDARRNGAAVLLIHSDLDELLALSDRVLVLFGGRVLESGWPNTTREAIGQLMMGLAPGVGHG